MRGASNVIPVVESLVSQMTPVVAITLIEADGTNWKVWSCNTYWTMRDMTITIGGESFTVVSVVQDSYVIVSGLAMPVGASYQLDAPEFRHGSHRKVNAEMMETLDATKAIVYLPLPRIREINDPEQEVVYVASIRPLFLYHYDERRDTIDLQQDEVIEPLNAMADLFIWLVSDQDGNFNTPEDINRREWMNFGDETVWGNDKLIFNRPLSGVELQMDLEVLPDGVCECDDATPVTCAPVPFYLNDVFEEDLTCGDEFRLTVVDTNDVGVGTYNEATNTVTVPAAGGSIDIDINGQPFLTGQSTNVDIPVLNTNNDPVGVENPLGTWKVGNAEVQVLNSDSTYDVTVAVVAEGAAVHNLPDETFYFQIDGVTVATETEPALATQTFNINWN